MHSSSLLEAPSSWISGAFALEESSLEEPVPMEADPSPDLSLNFTVVEEGTKRRKLKLIDSRGYTYNVKEKGKSATYWQCTNRPKSGTRRATVKVYDGRFNPGKSPHNHSVAAGALVSARVVTRVKIQTKTRVKPIQEKEVSNIKQHIDIMYRYIDLSKNIDK